MAGTARAASSVLTVTRTSSLPAACSARTCATVAATSAVSVLVIDWTTIGWVVPTATPPTLTVTVERRVLTGGKYTAGASRGRRRLIRPSLEDLVLYDHAQLQRGQRHLADEGSGVGVGAGGRDADPQRVPGKGGVDPRAEVTDDHDGEGAWSGDRGSREAEGERRGQVRAG